MNKKVILLLAIFCILFGAIRAEEEAKKEGEEEEKKDKIGTVIGIDLVIIFHNASSQNTR